MIFHRTLYITTFLAVLAAGIAGCEKDTTHTFRGHLKKSFSKPTPEQYLAMTGSTNPDERREGLAGLAKSPQAVDEALPLYAVVAGNVAEEVPVRAIAIGVLGLVSLVFWAVWLWHKVSDLFSEVKMVGRHASELIDLVGQVELPAGPAGL